MFGDTFTPGGGATPIPWTPTGSTFGLMGTTITTINYATAYKIGSLCFFDVRCTITTTGVGDIIACITPPLNIFNYGAGANPAFVATVADGAAADVGRGTLEATSQQIRFVKLNNIPWTIGAGRLIVGQGFYKIG